MDNNKTNIKINSLTKLKIINNLINNKIKISIHLI